MQTTLHSSRLDVDAAHSHLSHLIRSTLEDLSTGYEIQGDAWRAKSYARAAAAVKEGRVSLEDPEASVGIGKSTAGVIRKVHRGGKRAREEVLAELIDSKKLRAYRAFKKVLGVGEKKAVELVRAGLTSLSELRSPSIRARHSIDRPVVIMGLRYYSQLNARIERTEARTILKRLEAALRTGNRGSCGRAELVELTDIYADVDSAKREKASSLKLVPLGSYRRGSSSVGDIDILVIPPTNFSTSKPNGKTELNRIPNAKDDDTPSSDEETNCSLEGILRTLEARLGDDFILAVSTGEKRLSFLMRYDVCRHQTGRDRGRVQSRDQEMQGRVQGRYQEMQGRVQGRYQEMQGQGRSRKSKIPNSGSNAFGVCRVDMFRMKDSAEEASFLMHGTGSAEFNESLRALAKRQGYKLNEYGLFDLSSGERIPLESERAIFERLGGRYVPPRERSLGRILSESEMRRLIRATSAYP